MKKVVTIVGARPQFIKAAMVSRVLYEKKIKEIIIHTGQHFDYNMSKIFFDEMQIPTPTYNLNIGGGSHGKNTGKMIEKIEEVLLKEKPELVLIYGDTDSTLAAAISASKLHIPICHVEAGLRSYNRQMPEEINRIVSDQLSTFLFCPTETAVENLKREGYPYYLSSTLKQYVVNVGDVMYDSMLYYINVAEKNSIILNVLNVKPKEYILATIHRAENTDNHIKLQQIMNNLNLLAKQFIVMFPIHPRTKKRINTRIHPNIIFISPLGYFDMLILEKNSMVIVTDSGGMQKESYFHRVPCVTIREETEWPELIESGWNKLAPPLTANIKQIVIDSINVKGKNNEVYGNGNASQKIVSYLAEEFSLNDHSNSTNL